jgi:hypothetical protein
VSWFLTMSSASSDDDGCDSMMSPNDISGSSCAQLNRKRKSMTGCRFRAWSFRMTFKSNFGHATTVQEKGTLLTEHISSRTGHTRPLCVTCVIVFCDESVLSGPPNSAGLVSIVVQGYIQSNDAWPLSTPTRWIDYASWKPVPGGLTSDAEFFTNMRKFENTSNTWTRLTVFGKLGLNNEGRSAERQARQVASER